MHLAAELPALLAVMARMSAFVYAAPLLGDHGVPPRVRIGAAALLAASLSSLREPLAMADLPGALPWEVALGLVAGLSARVVLAAVETAGELIGLQLGLGFATTFDPTLGDAALPMRRLTYALAGLAFVGAGGIEVPARLAALPAVEPAPLLLAGASLAQRVGDAIVVGVRMATPMLVAITVANLAMGLATRAAPALNPFSVMLASTAVLGGVVLVATAPALAHQIRLAAEAAVAAAGGR